MTERWVLLGRVERVRRRLRDAATGAAEAADRARLEAGAAARRAADELDAIWTVAAARIEGGEGARALRDLDEEQAQARRLVAAASQTVKRAEEASAARRSAVRERERELRVTELLLAAARGERTRAAQRAEQRLQDDLCGVSAAARRSDVLRLIDRVSSEELAVSSIPPSRTPPSRPK